MSVIVVGATGFVGGLVVARLRASGHEVVGTSREVRSASKSNPTIEWVSSSGPELEKAVAASGRVVNLAGAHPFRRRWNTAYKAEMTASRVTTTASVVKALERSNRTDKVLVNASGIWFHAPGADVVETSPPGTGFLAGMITEWEDTATSAELTGTRVTLLRIGIGLGAGGGILTEIEPTFRLGMGGPVGSGCQFVPWVSGADIAGVAVAALADHRYRGPLAVVSPETTTMTEFATAVGRAMGKPSRLRTPAAAMRLVKGEVAELMTKSYRARPARLLELGHPFEHPTLEAALSAVYGVRPRANRAAMS